MKEFLLNKISEIFNIDKKINNYHKKKKYKEAKEKYISLLEEIKSHCINPKTGEILTFSYETTYIDDLVDYFYEERYTIKEGLCRLKLLGFIKDEDFKEDIEAETIKCKFSIEFIKLLSEDETVKIINIFDV